MKQPFKVGDIVETKRRKERALVVDTDDIKGQITIDIVWLDTGEDVILCGVQHFNLVSRAEG